MTQGLRHRPATIRRIGFGLVMLGATIGCHGTDKLQTSNLSPPPKLPSSLPAPSVGQPASAARTSTPPATPTAGHPTSWNNGDIPARGGLTPTGGVQPAPIATPALPTTRSNLPLTPGDVPTAGRGAPPPHAEPKTPDYQPPPVVLKDPIPPPPPATTGAAPAAPVSPPTAEAVPAAPALPSGGSVAAPSSPIAAPSLPLGSGGN